jgi:hypothetical protein
MIIIGLLLLIAALIFGIDFVFVNHHLHVPNAAVFGEQLGIHSEAGLFVIGAMTGAGILLALALMASGMRQQGAKAVRHRRDSRDAGRARSQRDQLAAENRELQIELERERAAHQLPLSVVERTVDVTDATGQRSASG